MPAGNFNGELHVHEDGTVEAAGPFDIGVTEVSEMCVWVVQRDGADDAIANAMGSPDKAEMDGMPDMPGMPHHSGLKVFDLGTPKARWVFPLTHLFKPVGFCAAPLPPWRPASSSTRTRSSAPSSGPSPCG